MAFDSASAAETASTAGAGVTPPVVGLKQKQNNALIGDLSKEFGCCSGYS
jgi:hypothetical protein